MDAMSDARERLLRDDPAFRRLSEKHHQFELRLDSLRSKRFLSEEEKTEEVRLKKLKLAAKDEMEQILRRTRD